MSSPGTGKGSLLLQTLAILKDDFQMAVIEADIDSTVDAEEIAATGIDSIQLRTGSFCHLDVSMVQKGLDKMDTDWHPSQKLKSSLHFFVSKQNSLLLVIC